MEVFALGIWIDGNRAEVDVAVESAAFRVLDDFFAYVKRNLYSEWTKYYIKILLPALDKQFRYHYWYWNAGLYLTRHWKVNAL